MNTVLVTGGAGFIGSNLVDKLVEQGNFVVVIDDLSMGKSENLPATEQVKFIKGSVNDEQLLTEVFETYTFHYVYHLAAVASVADSVERPTETHEINQESTIKLLEKCRLQNGTLKRFIFASSAAVYGDEPTLPKCEYSQIKPLSPYAIDKFSSEQFVLMYSHLYNVKTTAVRFFNVYGPRQNPNSPYSGIISILTNFFEHKKITPSDAKFTIFGDGQQTRDFIYVEDVVNAMLLLSKSKPAIGEVFNVATGKRNSILEMIGLYEKINQISVEIRYEEARNGDIKHSYADVSKLASAGFEAEHSLESGLMKYWDFEKTKI